MLQVQPLYHWPGTRTAQRECKPNPFNLTIQCIVKGCQQDLWNQSVASTLAIWAGIPMSGTPKSISTETVIYQSLCKLLTIKLYAACYAEPEEEGKPLDSTNLIAQLHKGQQRQSKWEYTWSRCCLQRRLEVCQPKPWSVHSGYLAEDLSRNQPWILAHFCNCLP